MSMVRRGGTDKEKGKVNTKIVSIFEPLDYHVDMKSMKSVKRGTSRCPENKFIPQYFCFCAFQPLNPK